MTSRYVAPICSTIGCDREALHACGSCGQRLYCSEACQYEDWHLFGHSQACSWVPPPDIGAEIRPKVVLENESSFECPLCIVSDPPKSLERKRKILALDGGGIKGLVTLEILKAIFEGKEAEFPVWKTFDMIAGTSTGSIIASMLCFKRFTIQQCIDFYYRAPAFRLSKVRESASKVFRGPLKSVGNAFGKLLTFNTYDSSSMEEVIKANLGSNTRLDKEYTKDPTITDKNDPRYVPYFIATANRVDKGPQLVLFTNYSNNQHKCTKKRFAHDTQNEAFVWEALMSSTAAPTYFSPYSRVPKLAALFGGDKNEFNDAVLIDGGVGNNSPAIPALLEASCLWNTKEIGYVLAIGTGTTPPTEISGFVPFRGNPQRLEDPKMSSFRRIAASLAAYRSLISQIVLGSVLYGLDTSESVGYLVESFKINYQRIDPALSAHVDLAASPQNPLDSKAIEAVLAEVRAYLSSPEGKIKLAEARLYLFDNPPDPTWRAK